MKKVTLIMLIVSFMMFPMSAYAATMTRDLNNYHYLHTNTVGNSQELVDRSGRSVIEADSANHNAVLVSIYLDIYGLGSSDRLYIMYDDGSTQNISITGDRTPYIVSTPQHKTNFRVFLDKSSATETFVAVKSVVVDDDDYPNDYIDYRYTATPPTQYGSLGSGTTPPTTGGKSVDHKYFYQDFRDQYRLDFWDQPSSTALIRLLFQNANGTTYERSWPADQVGGTLYLTCNGSYSVSFEDASGNQVGNITGLQTTKITSPSCSSFPEPKPSDDLSAEVVKTGCPPTTTDPVASWQPNPSAVAYDIYKDGQKIDTVVDTTYPLPGEGSYSVVARDQNGNVVGVSDINSRAVDSASGNQAEAICQCIEKLRPVLEEIRDNTSVLHTDLVQANQKLKDIDNQLAEIVRQITPTKSYPVPNPIQQPALYEPDKVMDRPYMPSGTVFSDPGDAAAPDAMPAAPEPEAWQSEGKTLQQEPEITKSPEMTQQTEMTKQPEMTTDPVMQPDPVLTADPPLQVQDQNYPLRWKSSDYTP